MLLIVDISKIVSQRIKSLPKYLLPDGRVWSHLVIYKQATVKSQYNIEKYSNQLVFSGGEKSEQCTIIKFLIDHCSNSMLG